MHPTNPAPSACDVLFPIRPITALAMFISALVGPCLTSPARSAQVPRGVVHRFAAVDCPKDEALLASEQLAQHLSRNLRLRVEVQELRDGLDSAKLLFSRVPSPLPAADQHGQPVLRVVGLVGLMTASERVIQVGALLPHKPGLHLGLPVRWRWGSPVPVHRLWRQVARAIGPVARVVAISRDRLGPRILVEPEFPLQPGRYTVCARLRAPSPSSALQQVGTPHLLSGVYGRSWLRPLSLSGSLPAGAVLALDASQSLTWPSLGAPVKLRTRPALVRTLVDGRFEGFIPCLARLGPENHQLRVPSPAGEGSGQAPLRVAEAVPATRTLTPPAGTRTETGRTMVQGGALSVYSRPTGAEVRLNGKLIGWTPVELQATPVGRHALSVWAPGYDAWSAEVEFTPGQDSEIHVQLAPSKEVPSETASATAAGQVQEAEEAPSTVEPSDAAPVFSVAMLPLKGPVRTREARVFVSPAGENQVRCTVRMTDGFPEGTRVQKDAGSVSVFIPGVVSLSDQRSRRTLGMRGISAVAAGQQSNRDHTLRLQIDVDRTAQARLHQDLAGGTIELDIQLSASGAQSSPAPPAPAKPPPGSLTEQAPLLEGYPTPDKKMALTFDDFPSPGVSEELLAVLKALKVRVTFFVIGHKAASDPWLLQRAHADGHLLANHTYSHRRPIGTDRATVYAELDRCSDIIRGAVGVAPRYFRPPGGRLSPLVRQVAADLGLRVVMWNAFSEDYKEPPPERIVKDILETARNRDHVVALLHDGHWSTVRAMPSLVHELRRRRYQLLTLDEFFGG